MTDDQDHSTPQSPDDAIFAQAVSWLTRLRERDTDAAAFQAWLAADPRHEAAFAEAECLWGRLELPARKLADTEIGRTRTARRQRPLRGLAAAAALMILLGAGLLWRDDIAVRLQSDHITSIGMRTPIDLADGSRITLNTDTAIAVDMADDGRHVRLFRGEAWFDVAPDAARPFTVGTPMGIVRVTGTRFNLRIADGKADVSLTEGRVNLTGSMPGEALTLAPGESAQLTAAGVSPPKPFDRTAVTAWLRGQFVFYDTPLSSVVAEINRYSPGRIVIAKDALRDLKVSGVFRTDNPGAALRAITDTLPLSATHITGYLVVLH
ncbi:MAG: iron dicitrate transport regulator FecR [Magnetovibrio sp.]|nr:iron dicitrate transport regulator FecR [Magnetovibrio sp.]